MVNFGGGSAPWLGWRGPARTEEETAWSTSVEEGSNGGGDGLAATGSAIAHEYERDLEMRRARRSGEVETGEAEWKPN
jgi:hypothetical protein